MKSCFAVILLFVIHEASCGYIGGVSFGHGGSFGGFGAHGVGVESYGLHGHSYGDQLGGLLGGSWAGTGGHIGGYGGGYTSYGGGAHYPQHSFGYGSYNGLGHIGGGYGGHH